MHPERDFRQTREEWERSVIDNAVAYTVFVPKVGTWRCDTLAEAEEIASEHERALLYAVTASGRSTLIKRP